MYDINKLLCQQTYSKKGKPYSLKKIIKLPRQPNVLDFFLNIKNEALKTLPTSGSSKMAFTSSRLISSYSISLTGT